MKALKSTEEGVWIEVVSTGTGALKWFEPFNSGQNNQINEQQASEEDSSLAQSIYEKHKPVVGENELYEFVAGSIRLNGLRYEGILNYRLNGIHKQLRLKGIKENK